MKKFFKWSGKILLGLVALIVVITLFFMAVSYYKGIDPPRPGIVQSDRLNVVWIIAEDLSPDIPAYGDFTAKTPHLDQLAAEGVVFENVFSTNPICAPSKSTLYTGQYQNYLGTQHMRTSWEDYEAVPPPETKIFTEYLRKEGYYTSKSGHADYQFGTAPTAWNDFTPGFFSIKRVRHWREREDNQPFFASIDIMDTHESQQWINPFADPAIDLENVPVPPYYVDDPVIRNDLAMMYSNIESMDKEVGKILKKLEKDGLVENTVVIFMGDHGRGMPRGKRWLYDAGLKVPMIVRWPGVLPPGTRENKLVSFVDMAPTMLSILGIDIPDHMQGKVFMGPESDSLERMYVYGARDRADEAMDQSRAIRSKQYKYILNDYPEIPWTQTLAFRDMMPTMERMRELHAEAKLSGGAAYWFSDQKPEEELYDLQSDPFEIDNLAYNSHFDSIRQVMRIALDTWRAKYDRYADVAEQDMIHQMWPGGEQPQTAAPEIAIEGSRVIISCPTVGATIEYLLHGRYQPKQWQIYDKPVVVEGAEEIEVRALRYGYAISESVSVDID